MKYTPHIKTYLPHDQRVWASPRLIRSQLCSCLLPMHVLLLWLIWSNRQNDPQHLFGFTAICWLARRKWWVAGFLLLSCCIGSLFFSRCLFLSLQVSLRDYIRPGRLSRDWRHWGKQRGVFWLRKFKKANRVGMAGMSLETQMLVTWA